MDDLLNGTNNSKTARDEFVTLQVVEAARRSFESVSYTHLGFWHERGIGTYTSINSVLKDDQSLQNEYADIRLSLIHI